MKNALRELVAKLLIEAANKIKDGSCELSEDEAEDIISTITHIGISKEKACEYVNCSRATFDNAVKDGKLPKGRKRRGFKELTWYKDELRNVLKR